MNELLIKIAQKGYLSEIDLFNFTRSNNKKAKKEFIEKLLEHLFNQAEKFAQQLENNNKIPNPENDELILQLKNGTTIRSSSATLQAGDYVRIVNKEGEEKLYYDSQEWEEEPVQVMGAILNAAKTIDQQGS